MMAIAPPTLGGAGLKAKMGIQEETGCILPLNLTDWLLPLPAGLRGLTHPVNFLLRAQEPGFSDVHHNSSVISEHSNILKTKICH
jgi:hypothetical protein